MRDAVLTMIQDGTDVDADFSVLSARDLLSRSVDELKELVAQRRNMTEEERKALREETEKEIRAKAEANGIKVENDVEKEIKAEDVTILDGHTSEVFICAWNPAKEMLASGSPDAAWSSLTHELSSVLQACYGASVLSPEVDRQRQLRQQRRQLLAGLASVTSRSVTMHVSTRRALTFCAWRYWARAAAVRREIDEADRLADEAHFAPTGATGQ